MKKKQKPEDLSPNNPFVPPKGSICLINDIPSELLSHIFEVGCADDDVSKDSDEDNIMANSQSGESGDEPTPADEQDIDGEVYGDSDATRSPRHPLPFPMVVSHVCRHWRNIALSSLTLWTTVTITSRAHQPYQIESTLLERSKNLPLDIDVNFDSLVREGHDVSQCPNAPKEPPKGDVQSIFSILTSHIHRWRSIKVTTADYSLMDPFQRAVSDPSITAAPQLTTLELYDTTATHWCSYAFAYFGLMSDHLIFFGGSAPLLTRLVLWGVPVDWDQPWIASAPHLKDLDLAFHSEGVRPSWAQFATILRGAPALEKLALRLSSPFGGPEEWSTGSDPGSPENLNAPIQLPRVTKFVLADVSEVRATALLRKLSFPALKHLSLSFGHGSCDYTNFIHELAGPAAGSSHTPHSLLSRLECLTIDVLPCDVECIETLYRELQNLRTLNIWMASLSQKFLNILAAPYTVDRPGEVWLPRLATLYVSGAYGHVLREVVQKRKAAGVPLGALYVDEICDVDNQDTKWLRENLESFGFWGGLL